MLVVEHLVGLEVVGPQRVVGAGGGAGAAAAGAGGGAGGHPADLQVAQGQEGQLQGGGKAAGRGDPPGAGQGCPVPLGQAVDEPLQMFRAGMDLAVGLGEGLGVAQPEVPAEVHQQQAVLDAGLGPGGFQGGQPLGKLAVGQGGEHHRLLAGGEFGPGQFGFEPALDDPPQVGVGVPERLAGPGPGGAPQARDRGMGAEPAQQFAPAVAGGAENGDLIQEGTPMVLRTLASTSSPSSLG